MRILIIRNFPSYMDVENNTYNIQEVGLAKALVRKGHICDIIFWTDKEEKDVDIQVDADKSIRVFYKHGKTLLKNTIYNGCEELFEKYDILQPCEYNQMQAWILAKKYPEKTIIYHGPYYSKFNKRYNKMCKIFDMFFLKKYIKNETKFMVKSKLAKEFLCNKGIKEGNVSVVGVGIDTEMLSSRNHNEEPDSELYRNMRANENKLKLLYIGRFEERRNIPFILKVYAEVLKRNNNVVLYMIGDGDQSYKDMVWALAEKLDIRDKIVYQQKMEQKYLSKIYALADIFLLPTEYEIFGMVLLEAMYYKNVVLTTENGGSSTLINDKVNGYVISKLNLQLWANTILKLNSKIIKKIGDNSKNTIARNYTWDVLVPQFEKTYVEKSNK